MTLEIPRRQYAALYGPTTGDRIRLADTELLIEIERDLTTPGDEAKFGGGKVLRDGMGQSASATSQAGALDVVITNAVIVDHWGIVKADIGIRGGRIVGDRQGRQSRHHERRYSWNDRRRGHRSNRGRRKNRHGGRHRCARPLYLPATCLDRSFGRPDHADRRRHRAGYRNQCHNVHARTLEYLSDDGVRRGLARSISAFSARAMLRFPSRCASRSWRGRSG